MNINKKEAKVLLDRMNMELRQAMYCTLRARSGIAVSPWYEKKRSDEHMEWAINHWNTIRTNGYTIRNGKIDQA